MQQQRFDIASLRAEGFLTDSVRKNHSAGSGTGCPGHCQGVEEVAQIAEIRLGPFTLLVDSGVEPS